MGLYTKAYHGLTARKVALGWRGLPSGFQPTYSQKEFFTKALDFGIIDAVEYEKLEKRYKLTWCRSLKME